MAERMANFIEPSAHSRWRKSGMTSCWLRLAPIGIRSQNPCEMVEPQPPARRVDDPPRGEALRPATEKFTTRWPTLPP